MRSSPTTEVRNAIEPTVGFVESVYGPRWPGASGLTSTPFEYSVRWT